MSNGQWAASVDLGAHPGSGWTVAGVGDFFGNGITDILWTNSTGGDVQTDIWELDSNGQWVASVQPGPHPGGFNVVGVGNVSGEGMSDILWQNTSTGDVEEWVIRHGQWFGTVDLGVHPGTGWTVAGIGNFLGAFDNGTKDILWHQA
jgi:hypothetical protein